jgi:hypothetical protein
MVVLNVVLLMAENPTLSGALFEFLLYKNLPDVAICATPAAPIALIVKFINISQFLFVEALSTTIPVSAKICPSE